MSVTPRGTTIFDTSAPGTTPLTLMNSWSSDPVILSMSCSLIAPSGYMYLGPFALQCRLFRQRLLFHSTWVENIKSTSEGGKIVALHPGSVSMSLKVTGTMFQKPLHPGETTSGAVM